MIQEVKQWIDEIQILQKKLTEAVQEREEAFASAAKWRSLYETEAQQRRTEANLARQNADTLKAEIRQLQELPVMSFEGDRSEIAASEIPARDSAPKIQQEVQQVRNEDFKAKLTQALEERDRLAQALRAEQAYHAQTRQALTTVLGDTVEHLTQERATRHKHERTEVQRQTVVITHETVQPQSKNPLLALPPTNSAQSRS